MAVKANIIPANLDEVDDLITTACYQFEDTNPYTC